MAAAAGLSVGVYGSLNSRPPARVNGFWIPGTFAQDAATYPERLRPIQELNLKYTRGYNYGAFSAYVLCLMSWATVLGFLRFVTGRQPVTWEKAPTRHRVGVTRDIEAVGNRIRTGSGR